MGGRPHRRYRQFRARLRHVAVSIGWASGGHLRLGVSMRPSSTRPTRPSPARRLAQRRTDPGQPDVTTLARLVGTGFPYRRDSRPPLMRRLMAVLTHCQDIRRNGAAALDLCDVACGRLDAYYESVSPWDFAAGLLIAREAAPAPVTCIPAREAFPKTSTARTCWSAVPACMTS